MTNDIDQLCINTIRFLAADAVQHANSGHPGMPMGMADTAYVLWTQFLKHNPKNPAWVDRDRFVLSAGHGSMLLYSMLHLTGYDLPLDEIVNFRQWESMTPGHPEYNCAPGVETTTGPLGQGFATGVGMALATRMLATQYNRPGHTVVDHHIYAIVSDGDLMEGVASEAASLAGHLGLSEIIYLYDDNEISLVGPTAWSFTEDVGARFEAYGWFVQDVEGHTPHEIADAIRAAQAETARPSLIRVHSHIGYGAPTKQDSAAAHGSPLGDEELEGAKEALGWPTAPRFLIPDEALAHLRAALEAGPQAEAEWQERFAAYAAAYPELAAEFEGRMAGKLPEGWDADLPTFDAGATEGRPFALATRRASGQVINALAPKVPALAGGAADLASSTSTLIDDSPDVQKGDFTGRNLRFGVREHAMGAMLNGMALHGGFIPYGGTFLVFSDYMRPSIRVAALSEAHVIYVFTHDSIGLGEDGPTHQPVEHLAALRAIPNLTVLRPSDANETVEAWKVALQAEGPVALIYSRQHIDILDRDALAPASGLAQGGYILAEAEGGPSVAPDLILIATGSEVQVALGARALLAQEGLQARVVAMPCWELFERQTQAYKESVLPPAVTARLAVEAGVRFGWERYVGSQGDVVSVDRFGASAPADVIWEKFGFTPQAVAARAKKLIE